MPKVKTHTSNVNIRMSPQLIEGLDAIALSKGMSRTEYLRFMIQTAIEKEQTK